MGTEVDDDAAQAFAAAVGELETTLDWERLGDLYCHEGGDAFFSPVQVEAQGEAGMHIAVALGESLAAIRRETPGRTLYVGAALAELVPVLFETLLLGREVVLHNLAGPEAEEINRALSRVEGEIGRALPRIHTGDLASIAGPFDHGWMTSVLTDPEAFPTLHDRLYGRTGEDAACRLAPGGGDEARELVAARRLMGELTARLALPALLTTTDEELPFARDACAARGWSLEVPDEGRLSAIVGDVVRHCRAVPMP